MIDAYYYLHTDGSLIKKPPGVVERDPAYFDSPFVRKVWTLDREDRETAWDLVVEALALQADRRRIDDLVEKWNLTNEDAENYAARRSFTLLETDEGWVATSDDHSPDPATVVRGKGPTALDAMAELAKRASLR